MSQTQSQTIGVGDSGAGPGRIRRSPQPGHSAIRGKAGPRVRAAAGRIAPPPRRAAAGDSTRASFPISCPRPAIRQADWTVAPIPDDLQDRRVEITGPTDRKMIINALNSGANVYMADFEDANSPTWHNLIDGQLNLCDAVDGTISFTSPEGKQYRLNEQTATLDGAAARAGTCRKSTCWLDGKPVPGSLFDFGLFFFHNAHKLLDKGSGPYFYLPKLESHLEARLWNDVFLMAQDELGIPRGSIRATVLIETIPAAFEMDEILYELREHSAGLNCGRWDYIFSIIKKFRKHPEFTMPDRAQVTMTTHCMHSYSLLAIKTCHRRGIHAIGGMAAQIPIKNDPQANEKALEKVRADKVREAGDGHDGTWVAHPGLVGDRQGGLRRQDAGAQPDRPPPRRRAGDGQGPADGPAGRNHRARAVPQHRRGHPVHGRLAGRQRLRAALQPDGRRRHGRNLPRPALAVGPSAQRRPGRRAEGHARLGPQRCSTSRWTSCEQAVGAGAFRPRELRSGATS